MINPVNSNKTVNTTADRPGTTRTQDQSSTQASQTSALSRGSEAVAESQVAPDIESARQLYQMEHTRSSSGVTLSSSAEVRSVLDNLLQQFSENPARAASAQLANVSQPMANLLKLIPA
ncbi:MAG: hypothetical protein ABW095_12225 [Candidatus Thiodiazotropha sp.]